jgi:hypothetical protein
VRLTPSLSLRLQDCAWFLETHSSGKNQVPLNSSYFVLGTGTNDKLRTFNESSLAQQAIQHVCLTSDGSGSGNTYSLPTSPCDRMRAEVFFPSCWDGVNLDSTDHTSHVSCSSSPSFFHYTFLSPHFNMNTRLTPPPDGLPRYRRL